MPVALPLLCSDGERSPRLAVVLERVALVPSARNARALWAAGGGRSLAGVADGRWAAGARLLLPGLCRAGVRAGL